MLAVPDSGDRGQRRWASKGNRLQFKALDSLESLCERWSFTHRQLDRHAQSRGDIQGNHGKGVGIDTRLRGFRKIKPVSA
jgi:hypothetical protein